jgi:hypothetical protein
LLTQKRADSELLKLAFELISNKEHLTEEGLRKIVAIKVSMNNGLSEKLTAAFPDVIPVPRPTVKLSNINPSLSDPHYNDNVGHWLAGFTEGEGCFYVNIRKSTSHILNETVTLQFRITQHTRDAFLMENILFFFWLWELL